jgi:hypothetical protein
VKARFWWLIGVLAIGCASRPSAAPPEAEALKKRQLKVYFEGEGPEQDIHRFQKFLEIALKDSGLAATDSSRDADATIKMRFSHEQRTEHQYSPVVWITLASPDRREYVAKSCNSISTSNSIFDGPIKSLNPVKLPAEWKKRGPVPVVYMSDSEMHGAGELLSLVKQRFVEDGYRITGKRGEEDAALQSIQVQKLAIPMRVDAYHLDEEVLDRNWNRIMWSSGRERHEPGTGFITYLGVEQGIKRENLPCKPMTGQLGVDGDQQSARAIAEAIRRYFDGKAHSD